MNIPYTVQRRPDTGVSNVMMGVWLFLASEVMLFGALFSAYALLRVAAPAWPSGRQLLSLSSGSVNTLLLLVMTGLVWKARAAATDRARVLMLLSTLFAGAFLGVKFVEYRGEIALGLVPALNTFLATYYTLTGLHALHVVGGMIANLWIVAGIRRAGTAVSAQRMQAMSLYWAFVDIVWIAIFVLMYLS